jgi:hypothetical protein
MRSPLRSFALLFALAACEPARLPPPPEDARGAPTSPAIEEPAVAGTDRPNPPAATPAPQLPAHRDVCEVDADCAVTPLHIEGPYVCCHGCGLATAGTSGWVAEVGAVCASYRVEIPGCYPLACPSGPLKSECRDGRCRAAW